MIKFKRHFFSKQGINKWIPLSDIQTRNFGDETGEFLLELSLGNIMTVFETEINLQTSGGPQGATAPGTVGGGSNGGGGHHPVATFKNGKIETTHLHFGSFDWNISIVTHNPNSSGAANMVRGLFKDNVNSDQELFRSVDGTVRPGRTFHVFLNRLTGFENSCRIQFRFVLGQGQFREDSGMLEQMSDMNGRSRGFQLDQHTFANLTSMGVLHLYFEFFSCNSISEVKVPIARSISPTINCYDRNKQVFFVSATKERMFWLLLSSNCRAGALRRTWRESTLSLSFTLWTCTRFHGTTCDMSPGSLFSAYSTRLVVSRKVCLSRTHHISATTFRTH